MEAEDQQDATVRTERQTDGSSDATENAHAQNAHAQNETRMPQVAEDPWETIEAQKDATVRTGGQTGGWEFRSDGSFDAAENWRRIQNVHAQNETAQGIEDPSMEPFSVVQDMMDVAMEKDGRDIERAAQVLEERFLQWDRDEQNSRRQVFMEQVQETFSNTAVAEGWNINEADANEVYIENEDMVVDWWLQVVYIANLAGVANERMLEEAFSQIGLVLEAGVEREGCGWVKFQEVEDAVKAIERFDGAEWGGLAMICGSSESVWEAQADY